MIFLRRLYRLISLFLWTGTCLIATVPLRFRGWKTRDGVSRVLRVWASGVAYIVSLRISVKGQIPRSSEGLIVSNHLGYIDIVTHAALFPLRFSPSTDVMKMPLIGSIVKMTSPVVVDRISPAASKKALRDYTKTLRHGIYLIVYPEGTSTDGKNGLLPFKSTPFEAALIGNIPIVPLLTRYYSGEYNDEKVCWFGETAFLPHLWKLLGLPAIKAELRFLEQVSPQGYDRKRLASYVHETMDREYRGWHPEK